MHSLSSEKLVDILTLDVFVGWAEIQVKQEGFCVIDSTIASATTFIFITFYYCHYCRFLLLLLHVAAIAVPVSGL